MLGTAPGRKTMIFLSGGVPITADYQSEFQETINTLNKSNVGVYAISALGLEGPSLAAATMRHASGGRGAVENSTPPGLRPLAAETGGFAYVNKNDLQAAMEQVFEEMKENYLLAYAPPNPAHDGSYHKIRVKVDRVGVEVRARNGYIDAKGPDLLTGKPQGKVLEARVISSEAGEIPVTLSAPYFFVRPGVARVNLSLSIPGSDINFKRHGDGFRSQLNVLGIVYGDDGSEAARFSDTMNLDYGKNGQRALAMTSFEYPSSFKIAPGNYTFKLVLSAGGKEFGKYVRPLTVDAFDGKQFTLSGPAFGDELAPCPMDSAEVGQAMIKGILPLVVNGMQVFPSSSNRFKKGTQPVAYVEVYEPLLESGNPQIGIQFNIMDRKTHQKVYSSNTISLNQDIHPGHPMVPAIFNLPMDKLPPGDYRIEIQGRDSAANISPVRTGDFSIE
jgi:hypothetical protein